MSRLSVVYALLAFASPLSAQNQEPQQPPTVVRIASSDEPGERLSFSGRVLDYDGNPLEKAAIVAYHADQHGLYNKPDSATRVPRLRGVAVTDAEGRFRFATIKPAPYPNAAEPAHIHLEVNAPAHKLRYVTFWFAGDPLITASRRQALRSDDETVVVKLLEDAEQGFTFSYEIALEGN